MLAKQHEAIAKYNQKAVRSQATIKPNLLDTAGDEVQKGCTDLKGSKKQAPPTIGKRKSR